MGDVPYHRRMGRARSPLRAAEGLFGLSGSGGAQFRRLKAELRRAEPRRMLYACPTEEPTTDFAGFGDGVQAERPPA